MGFQTVVNLQPGVAVPGDFAGANPRTTVQAGPGQLIAPSSNLLSVGGFGFVDPVTGNVSATPTSGAVIGFVHREQQGIIVNFLADSISTIQGGFPVTLFSQGDFWALLAGGGTRGQTIYADGTTGAPIAAASAPGASSLTATIGTTADIAGACVAGVLTVGTAATSGVISVGDTLTGTGVPAGTYVKSLGTGTGGTGTYNLAIANSAVVPVFASATNIQVTSSNLLNVTAVGSGALVPGQVIVATGIATGVQLASQSTGTAGSTGKYLLSVTNARVASGTVTTAAAVATKFLCAGGLDSGGQPGSSPGTVAPGALAVISTWGA